MSLIDRFCEKWADKMLAVFIGAYVILFSFICYLKYHSFGYFDWDFASDVTILWNSLHGRLLYYPFFEQNIFGAHLFLIYFLIFPVYFVFQHPLTILFLQSLFLGAGAYPLYLLARSELNKTFALIIALAYLLYPSVGFMNLFETHFDSYTIFFFFFALYYFQKDNFFKFLIFLFLAIICKESSSLVVFMFGIYAFFRKKSKRWIFTPILFGAGWFLVALKFVIPHFARDAKYYQDGFIFSIYYSHLGKNLTEIFRTVFFDPLLMARFALVPVKIHYLFDIFSPTSFLSFLSPLVLLMAVPIFMQNLLSQAWTHSQIYYQYVAMLIPFIFASVVFAFRKLFRNGAIFSKRNILLGVFLFISVISAFRLNSPQVGFLRYIRAYRYTYREMAKDALVKEIPRSASTIATFQFLPKLASRHEIYSMHFIATGLRMNTKVKYEPPVNLDYALIDFNEPLMINSFFPAGAPDNIRTFLENGNWRILKAADDIVLLKRDYSDGPRICEIVQNPKIENVLNANINNQLLLLGYNVISDPGDSRNILHLVFFWKRTADFKIPAGLFINFFGTDGKIGFSSIHMFGYRIYMPEFFPKDQIVKEERFILFPDGARNKAYTMKAGLFNLESRAILPVVGGERTDELGQLPIGEVLVR